MIRNSTVIYKDTVGILIFLLGVAFIALRTITPFLYGTQIAFLLVTGSWAILHANRLLTNRYLVVNLFFLIWSVMSILWAVSTSSTIKALLPSAQMVIICSLMSFYFDNFKKIDKVLYGFGIAGLIMVFYLIIVTPYTDWLYALNGTFSRAASEGRIGYSIGMNPNRLGLLCSSLILIWVYFFDLTKSKIIWIWIMLFSVILAFTKSRACFLMLVFSLCGYSILRKKRKLGIFIIIPALLILTYFIYWAVFNVPVLYQLLGFRMEGLIGIFNPSFEVDSSTFERMNMIAYGLDMFKNHPILGVGFGNYAYYSYFDYGNWAETYAHSNYVELLADVGIIGFGLYYILPFWSCITLWRCLGRTYGITRKMCVLLLVMITARLMFDSVKMSYDNEFAQIMNMICFCGAQVFSQKLTYQVKEYEERTQLL